MTGTGMPAMLPLPIQRKPALEIAIGLACVMTSVRPRQRYMVLSVMIKGGIFRQEMIVPLIRPTNAPTKRLAITAIRIEP